MKKIIILISILTTLTSCSPSFDFNEAEKLVENLKKDSRIYRLTSHENTIIINGQRTSSNKKEISDLNKTGFNYEYQSDYLKIINVSKEEFDSFLLQFKKTKAYSVDYKDGKAYFITDGFLDGSKGYLYSMEDLKNTKISSESEIQLHDGNIKISDKIKKKWYKATAWY